MELLSKYISPCHFLKNGLFRFTQPNGLNDAYEALPQFSYDQYSQEDWNKAKQAAEKYGIDPNNEEEIEAMFLKPFPYGRYDEKRFPSLWPYQEKRLRERPFQTLDELDREIGKKAIELLYKFANEYFLVFSLSRSIASEHMWAYYGDDHKGLEIRFNRSHPFFSDRTYDVRYNDEYVKVSSKDGWVRICGDKIDTADILNSSVTTFPLELLLRKATGWEQENEVRVIRNPDEETKIEGDNCYLFEIPREAFNAIVIGYKTSDECVENVIKKIKEHEKLSHVDIFRRMRTIQGVNEIKLT
ncbi:DUF2971 domain-containing protein [Terasakiella sp.]|uniref:DUF2971 domain-containing protein n=1 Tax=Terasakiella sp. TaxID=2034861 RepID=UPI003AA9B2B4